MVREVFSYDVLGGCRAAKEKRGKGRGNGHCHLNQVNDSESLSFQEYDTEQSHSSVIVSRSVMVINSGCSDLAADNEVGDLMRHVGALRLLGPDVI